MIPSLKPTNGRRLMVEFKCYRCGTTVLRPFDECLEEVRESGFQDLHNLRPPADWRDGGFYYPTFCPECAAAIRFRDLFDGEYGTFVELDRELRQNMTNL